LEIKYFKYVNPHFICKDLNSVTAFTHSHAPLAEQNPKNTDTDTLKASMVLEKLV
jgi:hypothetical protein